MKKTLAERLIEHAKKNPKGFTVRVENGKIKEFTPSKDKRYAVAHTNNDSISKVKKSFHNQKYTGYVGGWVDKEGNVFIDKTKVIGKLEKAKTKARKHNQQAIYDFIKQKEIYIKNNHNKTNNPIKRKNGKWYNSITKRYVSESYAKRINSYFKRNPEATFVQAQGHGNYKREKSLRQHSVRVKRLMYSPKTQLMRTKDKKGKNVYYSPVTGESLTEKEAKKFMNLDYYCCKRLARVILYRLTRDRGIIHHVIRWQPKMSFRVSFQLEQFIPSFMSVYNCMIREARKIHKKHPLGEDVLIYHRIGFTLFSKIDYYNQGRTSFVVYVDDTPHVNELREHMLESLQWMIDKLERNAYVGVHIETFQVHLFLHKDRANETAKEISKYRIGVDGLLNG